MENECNKCPPNCWHFYSISKIKVCTLTLRVDGETLIFMKVPYAKALNVRDRFTDFENYSSKGVHINALEYNGEFFAAKNKAITFVRISEVRFISEM